MTRVPRRRRVVRYILVFVSVLLLWLTIVGWQVWSTGSNDKSQRSDCIIVLGAAAYGSKPSPVYEGRLLHVITLYQSGLADKVILTGGFGDGAEESESAVGANYLVDGGLPRSALLVEEVSRTTRQNLEQAKLLMQNHELGSAIITSDPFHLKRAQLMADDLEIDAVTSPTPHSRYRSFGKRAKFLLWEVYLCHQYWFFQK